MLALNSRTKIPTITTRTSSSAPPVLARWVDIKVREPLAKPCRTLIKLSSLNQLPLRPYSHMSSISRRSKTGHEKDTFDISCSQQFGDKKENMLAPNYRVRIPKASTRTSTSAPPVLSRRMDITSHNEHTMNTHNEPIVRAKACNAFTKLSSPNQLYLRPYSHMSWIPTRSKTGHGKITSDISLSLKFGERKEKTWVSDVYTRVGSVSRAMEREKTIKKPSASKTSLLGISRAKVKETAWVRPKDQGRPYQDWRGVILSESTPPYTMLSNAEHQERLKSITRRQWSKGCNPMHVYSEMSPTNFSGTYPKTYFPQAMKYDGNVEETSKQPRRSYSKRHRISIIHEKVKRIGPHLEIFEAFKRTRRPPSQKRNIAAATCIQRVIRGWLHRARWNRVKMKAKNQGTTLAAAVKEFRKMMYRIKRRCGILDPTTPLIVEQLEDWLDNKLLYETMFTRRGYWKEMDRNELPKFFRDCGRFPAQRELNIAVNLVLEDSDLKIKSIKKNQAVEIAFMLFPPRGMKLKTAAAPRSTWVKPIVDGEESYKYLMSGHPILKTADLRIAANVVAAAIKERKKRENENYTSSSSDSD